MGKLIIFSAPSGSGKTTIVRRLLAMFPELEFSISATSRLPRGEERDGVDYYFFTPCQFTEMVEKDLFVEWEEVYAGKYYGTLKSETQRIWDKGHTIVFDVDVMGGQRLKKIFGADALSVFVMPPSIQELERRLECRGTDCRQTIECRLAKAEAEIAQAPHFDRIVINDDLERATAEAAELVAGFLNKQ